MRVKQTNDATRKAEDLAESFEDKEYRHHYIAKQIQQMLAIQIRLLREREGLSQAALGERADIAQPQISRLEDSDKPGVTLATLERIAEAFDVGLVVHFAPFSEIVDWNAGLPVPGLDNETYTPKVAGRRQPMDRRPLESTITTAILKALNTMPDTYAIKLHGSMYSHAGTPDLCVVRRGQAYFLEVKRPGAKSTPAQVAEMARWTGVGAICVVVRSVQEAVEAVG